MATRHTLTVIGVDPGVTTGWAAITVPTDTIFGDAPGEIVSHRWGMLEGPESAQAKAFCRIAKRYIWPTMAMEDFDARKPQHTSHDSPYLAPVRVAAVIKFCIQTGMAGAVCGLEWQMPGIAMDTATDERLKTWGLYTPGKDHPKDATRHAITLIRRAKADAKLRNRIFHWPGDGDPHGGEQLT
jgi:hypothetical protein